LTGLIHVAGIPVYPGLHWLNIELITSEITFWQHCILKRNHMIDVIWKMCFSWL